MEKVVEQSGSSGSSPSSCTYQVSKHSAEMLHNLNAQRKDGGRFCDVTLRVGEESFPAHRAVLAACSEYFESVFSCGRPEEEGDGEDGGGDAKELEMHTISPKVFRDILDFAYTSRIVVRLECFPELMTAAKFLLMRSVLEICSEVIKQSNVQILVPTSRGREASLFQGPTGASELLGFQVAPQRDTVNGGTTNGLPFANNGHVDGNQTTTTTTTATTAVLLEDDTEPTMPDLQPVDGVSPFPSSSEEVTGNPFHDTGSPGSKRHRGRPKRETTTAVEPEHVHQHSSPPPKDNGLLLLFPCGSCGKAFTEASRLKNHQAQHGAAASNAVGVNNVRRGSLSSPEGGEAARLTSSSSSQACKVEHGVVVVSSHEGLPSDSNGRKRERIRRHVGCDVCGKVFRDIYHLNRHKLSHSGEKPYGCHICGLRFKRKDRMSYHVRSHDGSVGKPYVCQSCGKGFSRPDHLNGHIRQVHTTERPHKCQICNASFATRDRLRSHLACHEDKIPCKVCGKFLRAAYMTDHLKKHSEGTHNYCGICNKGFSTASYLKVHIKAHHAPPSLLPPPALQAFAAVPRGGPQTPSGNPYLSGRPCSVQDLCASRQLLVPLPEAEGGFHGLSGPPCHPQPGPPALGLQGALPCYWECVSGFPSRGPVTDGEENPEKCPHLGSEESDPSFGDLSNGDELKSPQKTDAEMTSPPCNGSPSPSSSAATRTVTSPLGSKVKADVEKKFICGICGQAFRTKSYLNKHQHRVHKGQTRPPSGPTSPFSSQQNMSLLESFGFQIVQSAFASSLVDANAEHSGIDFAGK
ncbi:hypothetical protein NHX12_029786 [Muraenolepis orangiensis]|uniref:POZ/BTB and AT hook containing zinc finger 1 n=1 Tax=Muraenolepis orangiensis TaxID=630683 RepID=A0A9Q0EA13_9TELE|nr:hypothetical protein NHX12_029786 [Muraenolepis orangiensis]